MGTSSKFPPSQTSISLFEERRLDRFGYRFAQPTSAAIAPEFLLSCDRLAEQKFGLVIRRASVGEPSAACCQFGTNRNRAAALRRALGQRYPLR